jgi:hypothetical protein
MTFTGITPHPKQREMINSILQSDAKYHVACVGRQFGKSMMAMNLILYWAINEGPCKVLWVSPVYSQTSKVMKELMEAIGNSGIVQRCNYSDNYIKLKNGSEIYFRSAERYDNMRGMTMDFLCCDESAYMKNEAWTEAIKPIMLVRGKKVLFISTPKGSNWFKELYQLGKSSDYPNYKAYKGSSYDTPFIAKEEIEDAKRTLPENVFKQEYLAEFIDSGGEVFQNIDKNTFPKYTRPEGKVFCGIDLGRANDATCAVFQDSTGKVVDVYRNNQVEWSTMVKDMLVLIKKWNATVTVEVNSIGDVIVEQIKKEWQDTHPFVTSSKSKNEIIEGLILDMNESTVQIPSEELFPFMYQELSVFTYEYNPKTRNIKYGHPNGLHDDTVMALAICNLSRKTRKSYGTYAVMGRQ